MFTGIIETIGVIEKIEVNGTNKTFYISSSIACELKVDQSVAHNGICLTVEALHNNTYSVTAIQETLQKTNAKYWQVGNELNIERCTIMNGRLDGHLVQGHVDDTAVCTQVLELDGSWQYSFSISPAYAALLINQGSVCVNGISLTCFNVSHNGFSVAIIPYTFHHTNIKHIKPQSIVNIEFDVVGKYILRHQSLLKA